VPSLPAQGTTHIAQNQETAMNATLTISATEAPVINVPDTFVEEVKVDPLPRGDLMTGMNPENAEVVLHYKYTEDREGGLFYFITYDGQMVKGFAHQGMAIAVYNACCKTWRKDYRRLLPAVMRVFMSRIPNEMEPLDEQLDEILGQAIQDNRAWKRK
jgi:hypothetical protein